MTVIYEIDHNGIRIYGYNQGLSFYDPDRTPQQQIYLKPDNTLNIGGGGSASSLLTETSANGIFVRLDGKNWASWKPDSGTQSIVGSFNLAGAAYEYKINGAHALSIPGTGNLLAGAGAGAALAGTGTDNVILGYGAGASLTSEDDNVVIGSGAAPDLTDPYNVIIGYQAGFKSTDSTSNVFIGMQAAYNWTGGIVDNLVVIGYLAARAVTAGNESVIIGDKALLGGSTTYDDVIIGQQAAGNGVYAGEQNVVIGADAGFEMTTALRNVLVGYQAGYWALTEGDDNVLAGYQAGYALTTGDENVVVGSESGIALTTGGYNVLLGYRAGYAMTDSSGAVVIGGYAALSGSVDDSVVIGTSALGSGASVSTADDVIIGPAAVRDGAYAGNSNIIIGNEAARDAAGASQWNVIIGAGGGEDLTTGSENVLLGLQVAQHISSATRNNAMGTNALHNLADGDRNVAIGNQAGYSVNGTVQNTYVGAESGFGNIGDYNTVVGAYASYAAGTRSYNAIFGYSAGYDLTSGHDLVLVGSYAGYNLTTGADNVFVGFSSGYTATTADETTAVGQLSFENLTTGNRGVAIGFNAAFNVTEGSYVTAVGSYAAASITTANAGVFLGYQAGYYETAANKLFIDNAQRTNEADGRVKALVYGIFDAATANQYFTINGHLLALHDVSAPQLISTIAIGTTPLVITSTTLVSNLNADLLDNEHGAYYLDLGNATGHLPLVQIASYAQGSLIYGGAVDWEALAVGGANEVLKSDGADVAWDVVDADDVTYTPAVVADWDGGADPGNANDAFDQLAERTKDIEDLTAGVIGATWDIDGTLAVVVDAGEQWVMPEACTIVEVIAVVKDNGSANDTIVDVNKNGVTLFTTQANRPTIAHDDADNYDVGIPDITAIAQYDEITLDIDAIATDAADLRVILVIEGIGGAGGGGGDASTITYTPAVADDWDGGADPGNVDDALDQLATRTNICALSCAQGTNTFINATWTAVIWTEEVTDAPGWWVGGDPTVVTITANGAYRAIYSIRFANAAGGNSRGARVVLDAVGIDPSAFGAGDGSTRGYTMGQAVFTATAGQEIVLQGYQDSGGNLSEYRCNLSVEKIGE